jgi:hypothetical protein
MSGIKYTSQLDMQVPPTEDNHVVRKKELDANRASQLSTDPPYTADGTTQVVPLLAAAKAFIGKITVEMENEQETNAQYTYNPGDLFFTITDPVLSAGDVVTFQYLTGGGGIDVLPAEVDPVYRAEKNTLATRSQLAAVQAQTDTNASGVSDLRAALEAIQPGDVVSALTYDPATHTITLTKGDGVTVRVVLPVGSVDTDGFISKSDIAAIAGLISDVASLKAGGVWRATFATYADLITAYPALDVSGTAWFENDDVIVKADESETTATHTQGAKSIYRVTVSGDVKTLKHQEDDDGAAAIEQATNDSLGVSKGDNTNTPGKCYSELDGTWSVIGWDALTAQLGDIASVLDAINGEVV